MSEQRMLQRMILVSLLGFILCLLAGFVIDRDGLLINLVSYLLGVLPALIGFLIISLQFQAQARTWVLFTLLGYGIRLLLYGSAILVLFLIHGNPFLLLAGFIVPKLGLISLAKEGKGR